MWPSNSYDTIDGKVRLLLDGKLTFLDEIQENWVPETWATRLFNVKAEGDKSLLHERDLKYIETQVYTLETLRFRIGYEGFRYTLLHYFDFRSFSHHTELATAWKRYSESGGKDRDASKAIQRILRNDLKNTKKPAT